jgi:3'-phosphoadenosine 5'-phosphosulfate sulfotransferase (PAPS reductase)/FAD synthetase
MDNEFDYSEGIPRKYANSDELCKAVSKRFNNECLLSFSRGKDSIACFYQLKRHFKTVHITYCMTIPDLEFEEESLDYFEKQFGQKIFRIVHKATLRQLRNRVFQDPTTDRVIANTWDIYNESSWNEWLGFCKDAMGLDDSIPVAVGNRVVDSIQRRQAFKTHGSYNPTRNVFYPIYDWPNQTIYDCLAENKCRLPEEYRYLYRSFDGLQYAYIIWLKKHKPKDYKTLTEWFPLLNAEILRYEQRD